jgi:glycosyltransferase involved in cell wall biosynthesis
MLNPAFSAPAYMHNLCDALVDAGCAVELFTGPAFGRASRPWRKIAYVPRIAFYRRTQLPSYGAGRLTRPLWRCLRLAGHLTSLARLTAAIGRYDVLHVHFPPVLPLDARWLQLIRRRIPVVHTVHNLWPHGARRDARDRQRLRRLYHACHHLIAHTEDTVQGLAEEFGVPPERISLIPHGNFRHFWNQERASVPLLDDAAKRTPTILMFGELRPSKGTDVLLRAAAMLRDRGVAFRVVLAGAPFAATQPYHDLARELDIEDRVMFHLRYIEEDAVPSYFEAASVVALPYRAIDQSGVAIAALTMGRAIVATRIAGLADLVEQGRCGLLVPVDDVAGLAAALERLLTDAGLRHQLETNARCYAETALAWEPIAARTLDAYRTAGAVGAAGRTPYPSGAIRPSIHSQPGAVR